MEHVLTSEQFVRLTISIAEKPNGVLIKITNFENSEEILLSKKELHSFIGTLLHAQSKMKGGQNG